MLKHITFITSKKETIQKHTVVAYLPTPLKEIRLK